VEALTVNPSKVIGTGMAIVALAVFGLVLADDGLGLAHAELTHHSAYLVSAPTAYPEARSMSLFRTNPGSTGYVTPETFSNVIKERLELQFTATAVADGAAMGDDGVIPFAARDGWAYYAIWASSPLRDARVTQHGIDAGASVAGYFGTAPTPLTVNGTPGQLYVARAAVRVIATDPSRGLQPPYTDFNGSCSVGGSTDRAACEKLGGTYTPPNWPAPVLSANGLSRELALPAPLHGQLFAPGLRLEFPAGAVSVVKREYPVPGMATVLKFSPLFLALGVIATLFGFSRRR